MHINPYLMFHGQCEEAFRLYERITGGKIVAMLTHEGTPAAGSVPPEWQKKIIHARLQIGQEFLMGSDAPPDHFRKPQGFSVSLTIKDPGEAERKFKALAEGGSTNMPFGKTFFAKGFGMCVDRFGIPWMVHSPLEG